MFKETFKYYKRKQPPPDFTQVLDVSQNLSSSSINMLRAIDSDYSKQFLSGIGLKPPKYWQIFTINSTKGLIFIKNPFTPLGQRYWITRCLKDYTKKPQKLNIDAHNYLNDTEDWWTVCCHGDTNNESLQRKLRWATLGYHHNWDTKVYSESTKDEFPSDLAVLSQYVAKSVGFEDFNAEAAIVNFYHMDSTLSGHTDHSEDNLEAPLLSFSFGQSAIFLIGGLTEACPAVPIFIHSGDIMIMSKESRLCYHAVPRITSSPTQPWQCIDEEINYVNDLTNSNIYNECKNKLFWKPFDNYIQKSRINVNVRQVLKIGQHELNK